MRNFKVWDKVYYPAYSKRIEVVLGTDCCTYPLSVGVHTFTLCGKEHDLCVAPSLLHATQENWELLSKRYPNVEFEKPKAVGSDLTRQMLADGVKDILCWVSDLSDDDAITRPTITVVRELAGDGSFKGLSYLWRYAVPIPRNYYAMDEEEG